MGGDGAVDLLQPHRRAGRRLQHARQPGISQRLPDAVAAQQQHVAWLQRHRPRDSDIDHPVGRPQGGQQQVALRVGSGALVVEHAAGHHLLHHAVVGGARQHLPATEQVGTAVAAVGPDHFIGVQVHGRHHHRGPHGSQLLALFLACHDRIVGLLHQGAQESRVERRRTGKRTQQVVPRGGRGHIPPTVSASTIGHQAGHKAAVMPMAMHVLVVAATALLGDGNNFDFHGTLSGRIHPPERKRSICSS